MSIMSKITAGLLIVAFLAMCIGSAFGFAICDHGVLSKTHIHNHHQGEHFDLYDEVPLSDHSTTLNKHSDNCHDLSLHVCDGILEKSDSIQSAPIESIELFYHATFNLSGCKRNVIRPNSAKELKVTQSVLSLRTTILLI